MNLDYVPLLRVMRELHSIPRGQPPDFNGMKRFRQYVHTIFPRKKRARVTAEVAARLADVPGDFKVGLVVADDLMGVGTNRYDCEFAFRFGPRPLPSGSGPPKRSRWLKDYWLQCMLWSSESPSERAVREAILPVAHRVAYMHRHGPALT